VKFVVLGKVERELEAGRGNLFELAIALAFLHAPQAR
jgi:hypothetical protein